MGKLIEILKPDFSFSDERGNLSQLVHEGYKQVNVVTSKGGVFRGGHFHKDNIELFYVVYGEFEFIAEKDSVKEEYMFKAGDMFLVKPYVIHSFNYLKESCVVALYDKGVEHADGSMDSFKV